MARIIFVTLLVLAAVCAVMAHTTPVCPENEYWNECGNPCTEPKCGVDLSAILCLRYCEARCECVEGYCRNKAGKCVLIKKDKKNINQRQPKP